MFSYECDPTAALLICLFLIVILHFIVIRCIQKQTAAKKQSITEKNTSKHYFTDIMSPIKPRIPDNLVKQITLKTCVGIYDELRKKKPKFFRHAPNDGLELTIDYVDTINDNTNTITKIIVAVHGLPGTYLHFDKLIDSYRNTNVRVIVPNLPDFSHTRKTKSFWHTTKEKATFLKDFLHQLNITTIDCLVCHSFGIQTIAAIWDEPGDIKIKSVALLSPQPLFDDIDFGLMIRIFRYRSEWWYNALHYLRFYKLPFFPLKFTHMNEFLHSCCISIEDDTRENMYKRIDLLVKLNIPTVLIYGTLEKLISKWAIAQLNERLTIKPEEVVLIDCDNNINNPSLSKSIESELTLSKNLNSFLIKNGGHFSHCNYYPIANKLIDNLLYFHDNTTKLTN